MTDVIIIGGGAAGLAAAGSAAASGSKVLVLDRNEKTGKKLYITGKGRCNLTNNCEPREFLSKIVRGAKFMQSAIYRFPPSHTMRLFEELGLKLKTERGGRVFPASDKSSDVIKALTAYAERNGAQISLDSRVTAVEKTANGFSTTLASKGKLSCKYLIIACGGKSYSSTGSDGDGMVFAQKLGHGIVETAPALVPIKLKESVKPLEGLSLKNISVSVSGSGFSKSEFGELMFTADGVSGPCILTLSSLINRYNLSGARLSIDLKPALDREKLDGRILSDFKKYENKQLKNALNDLLPRSLIPYIIKHCYLDPDKPVNVITKEERRRLLEALKALSFTVDRLYDVEYGIVTSGGVDLSEVNPSTMESKLVRGLYFAGETLDIDALTGGFNIQTALSTGFAAGEAAGGRND